MISVNVIIVTYNGESVIGDCLESVFNSIGDIDLNVIVCDNQSTDKTVDIVIAYPEISLTTNKCNIGFGAANNIAIASCLENSPDYFLLLNQDAYVYPNTIQKLIDVAEAEKDVGIVSPIHLDGTGKKLDTLFRKLYLHPDQCPQLYDDLLGLDMQEVKSAYELPFVNAAAWLLPLATIDCVGGFDPLFYHYGEDNNYVDRCNYHGRRVFLATKAHVRHDRSTGIDNALRHKNAYLRSQLIEWLNPNQALSINKYIHKYVKGSAKSLFQLNVLQLGNNIRSFGRLLRLYATVKRHRSTYLHRRPFFSSTS